MSGTALVDITDTVLCTYLRTYLRGILPGGIEVVRGQGNRVPMPANQTFVVMTVLDRVRLATDLTIYAGLLGNRTDMASTRAQVQLDVYGPASGDMAQIITTLFRSDAAVDAFAALGPNVVPLYSSEPRNLTFLTGEAQYDVRWSIDLALQINPTVTTPQQFAADVTIGVIDVDVTYPAGAA